MGYELHIVRQNDWDDYEENSNISLEEWLAYVQTDYELELTNGYQVKIPGSSDLFQNVPGFCNWIGHSTKKNDDNPWFDYGHGMISTKYPDDETIKKMISIADKLNGKVQGDDGEFYNENYINNGKEHFFENINKQRNLSIKKPWWKFW